MKKMLWFGTNTKMFMTARETCGFINGVSKVLKSYSELPVQAFVIPSYTSIPDASRLESADKLWLGAQNMNWEERGESTGEISPLMLAEFGIKVIEIAHSERRRKFMETDETANKKVLSAIAHGFTALLCIGETKAQRDAGITKEVIRTQVKAGLFAVQSGKTDKLWIAYEPAWAIGTAGTPAFCEDVAQAHLIIRGVLCELFGENGNGMPILFGGSVNPDNAGGYMRQKNVDGLFVGRAAWTPEGFGRVLKIAYETWLQKEN